MEGGIDNHSDLEVGTATSGTAAQALAAAITGPDRSVAGQREADGAAEQASLSEVDSGDGNNDDDEEEEQEEQTQDDSDWSPNLNPAFLESLRNSTAEQLSLRNIGAVNMQSLIAFMQTGLDSFGGGHPGMSFGNEDVIAYLKRREHLSSESVERAFRLCPRELFIPPSQSSSAYHMCPLRLSEYDFNVSAPEVYASALEHLSFEEGNSFLDIGSGCGQLTAMGAVLCGKDGRAVGIDLNERIIDFCRDNLVKLQTTVPEYAESAASVEFLVCNAFVLDPNSLRSDSSDGRFDRIHCGATCPADHLDDLIALLRPGGKLVTPCRDQMLLVTLQEDGRVQKKCVASVRYGDLVIPTNTEIIMHRYERMISAACRLPQYESRLLADVRAASIELSAAEIRSLYLCEESSDFVFELDDGDAPVPAHKAVLRARSGYFRALFLSNMRDYNSGKAHLPEDFSRKALLEVLRYMYTDEAQVTTENCLMLLELGKFYDVSPGLFYFCEGHLHSTLSVSNATTLLLLSSWYACAALKRSVIQFILDHLEEVRSTLGWRDLDCELMNDVLTESWKRNKAITGLVGQASLPKS